MGIFLTRKYPFPQSSNRLRDCAVYSAIVFFILYLLQPFGFSEYKGNKFIVSFMFGAVTFGCSYSFFLRFCLYRKGYRLGAYGMRHCRCL